MINEKTTQKVLFVWLIFLFLLTTRVLLVTKAGVLLAASSFGLLTVSGLWYLVKAMAGA